MTSKTHKVSILIQLSLFIFTVLITACREDSEETAGTASLVKVGDTTPYFDLLGPDGKQLSSLSLEGQCYILNFFDTRCPDCQQLMPVLQRIYDKYHQTVPIVNVPRSQTREDVLDYWNKHGFTMPFYIPSDRNLYYKFATSIIPRTYVIDSNGTVLATFDDSPIADYETLDSLLRQAAGDVADADNRVRMSLMLKVPANSGAIDEYYFHNEYTISHLDLFFFDAHTKQLFTKATIKELTQIDDTYDTQYDITYLYETVELKTGIYDIFAIANYDYCPDSIEEESQLLDMIDSTTYKGGIEANIPDNGPVMTSRATALLAVDLTPWANKDYVLTMEMERVMAKLQIGVAENTFQLLHNGRKYADINITNYKLVNLNRQYYLFQHRDSLPQLTQQPTFSLPYHYSEYNELGDQYVVDPLFYKKTPDKAAASLFANHYQSWFGDFNTSNFASMPSANNHGFAYVLENTAYKDSQKNGYSPGIVFKAAVNPTFVYLYDASQKTLREEYRPEYWPGTIYLYRYYFYGSIQAINIVSGLQLDELETYTDAQLKNYGIKQSKFNMGVYETYYTYWIEHRHTTTDPMAPMRYALLRNNFYKLTITGINGIGNSVITPDILRDNYPNSYSDVTVSEGE